MYRHHGIFFLLEDIFSWCKIQCLIFLFYAEWVVILSWILLHLLPLFCLTDCEYFGLRIEFICLLFGRTSSFSLNDNSMHWLSEKNESLVRIKGSVKSWSLLCNSVCHSKNIKCYLINSLNIKIIIRLYSYSFWYWSYA